MFWFILIFIILFSLAMNWPTKEGNHARQRERREKRQKELEQQKIQQETSRIIQSVPAIDLLCNVALTYESEWTSPKVKTIKQAFSGICNTAEDQEFLKNRIKLKSRPSLDKCISDFMNMQYSEDDINIVYEYVVTLVAHTCNYKEEIFHKCLSIGTSLGINYDLCHENISEYLEKIGFDNQFNQEHESNQQENQDYTYASELEAAAIILGITINANLNEIKNAYRMKIKDYHPDRNVNVTPAVKQYLEQQATLINNARDTLINNL